jgi:hypothetical protein
MAHAQETGGEKKGANVRRTGTREVKNSVHLILSPHLPALFSPPPGLFFSLSLSLLCRWRRSMARTGEDAAATAARPWGLVRRGPLSHCFSLFLPLRAMAAREVPVTEVTRRDLGKGRPNAGKATTTVTSPGSNQVSPSSSPAGPCRGSARLVPPRPDLRSGTRTSPSSASPFCSMAWRRCTSYPAMDEKAGSGGSMPMRHHEPTRSGILIFVMF